MDLYTIGVLVIGLGVIASAVAIGLNHGQARRIAPPPSPADPSALTEPGKPFSRSLLTAYAVGLTKIAGSTDVALSELRNELRAARGVIDAQGASIADLKEQLASAGLSITDLERAQRRIDGDHVELAGHVARISANLADLAERKPQVVNAVVDETRIANIEGRMIASEKAIVTLAGHVSQLAPKPDQALKVTPRGVVMEGLEAAGSTVEAFTDKEREAMAVLRMGCSIADAMSASGLDYDHVMKLAVLVRDEERPGPAEEPASSAVVSPADAVEPEGAMAQLPSGSCGPDVETLDTEAAQSPVRARDEAEPATMQARAIEIDEASDSYVLTCPCGQRIVTDYKFRAALEDNGSASYDACGNCGARLTAVQAS